MNLMLATKLKELTIALSAFLAFTAALSTVMLSRSLNRSLSLKTEAAMVQSEIADQWAYYQSRNNRIYPLDIIESIKGRLTKDQLTTKAKIEQEKDLISAKARQLETTKNELSNKSQIMNAVAQRFSSASALLQIALMMMPMILRYAVPNPETYW